MVDHDIAAGSNQSASQRRDTIEKAALAPASAKPLALSMIAWCNDTDERIAEMAVAVLESMGPPRAEDISALITVLQSEAGSTAYWAATLLGRLQAGAADAVSALATASEKHPEVAVRERAAWALGQIGPAAASAVTTLQAAAASNDRRLARLATEAIKSILGST